MLALGVHTLISGLEVAQHTHTPGTEGLVRRGWPCTSSTGGLPSVARHTRYTYPPSGKRIGPVHDTFPLRWHVLTVM